MKKIIFLGAVAILLSLGLVLVSCSSCPGDGDCKVGDLETGAGAKQCTDACLTAQAEALEKKYSASDSLDDFKKYLEEIAKLKCDC